MLEITFFQHLALVVNKAGLGRPQHQFADGVGEASGTDAFLHQLFRRGVVSGEQDLKRCAVLDLCVELAGGTKGKLCLVAGFLFEVSSDFLHRRGEVGGDGDDHFVGAGQTRSQQGSGDEGFFEHV